MYTRQIEAKVQVDDARAKEKMLSKKKSKDPCCCAITLKVLVATLDAQWEGMGDVGLVRYEPALLPACPTIRVLSYSN